MDVTTDGFRLMLGDCLKRMAEIPDSSIDMVLCDLPYGTTACKWDSVIPFEPLWAQYRRVCKRNAAIVLTASQPFTSALVISNVKGFRYELIWEKQNQPGFWIALTGRCEAMRMYWFFMNQNQHTTHRKPREPLGRGGE